MRLVSNSALLIAAILALSAEVATADVQDQVEWSSFLGRHDPIWFAGGDVQICANVSTFDPISKRIVKVAGGGLGTATCSSNETCVADASIKCSSIAECVSFGISPVWRDGSVAQLYSKNNTFAVDNKDWTLYVEDTSKPTHRHCYNTTRPFFTKWQDGPFFGNGLVGGLFRFENSTSLRMDLGRTDVWDRRTHGTPGYIEGAGDLYMRPRLPVGHLQITTPPNCSWSFRTELLAAEIVANVSCSGGPITQLRAFAPSEANGRTGMVLEVINPAPDRQSSSSPSSPSASPSVLPQEAFVFVAEESETTRHGPPKGYKPNPPALQKACAGVETGVEKGGAGLTSCMVSTQTLLAGGDYAVAWGWGSSSGTSSTDSSGTSSIDSSGTSSTSTSTTLYIAIAADMPRSTSAATAIASIHSMGETTAAALRADHRRWWAAWYPKSFLSIAQSSSPNTVTDDSSSPNNVTDDSVTDDNVTDDSVTDDNVTDDNVTDDKAAVLSTALEAFYWIQMYKMASATREEGPALDLMGPWFQPSSWLFYWFDLNEQLQYWPVYTANRLDLGKGE
jgi:hypothetical protein